jgi:hypothetical protein
VTLTDSGQASGPGATVTFPYTATDTAGNTASAMVTVTIVPKPALAITTTSLPGATEGVPYSATLAATGGTTPFTWSVTGLPAGLSVDPTTGVISGTPAAGTSAGSPYTLGVTVTDSDTPPETASTTLSLSVGVQAVDASMNVIVGHVRSGASKTTLVGKVSNVGTIPLTVCDTTSPGPSRSTVPHPRTRPRP